MFRYTSAVRTRHCSRHGRRARPAACVASDTSTTDDPGRIRRGNRAASCCSRSTGSPRAPPGEPPPGGLHRPRRADRVRGWRLRGRARDPRQPDPHGGEPHFDRHRRLPGRHRDRRQRVSPPRHPDRPGRLRVRGALGRRAALAGVPPPGQAGRRADVPRLRRHVALAHRRLRHDLRQHARSPRRGCSRSPRHGSRRSRCRRLDELLAGATSDVQRRRSPGEGAPVRRRRSPSPRSTPRDDGVGRLRHPRGGRRRRSRQRHPRPRPRRRVVPAPRARASPGRRLAHRRRLVPAAGAAAELSRASASTAGAFYATEAYPREFRERSRSGPGSGPGPPTSAPSSRPLAGQEGLSIAEVLVQMRRFSEYFNACAATAIARERFDLLLLYQPIVDEVEHRFLLVDPRQRGYSQALAATARARGHRGVSGRPTAPSASSRARSTSPATRWSWSPTTAWRRCGRPCTSTSSCSTPVSPRPSRSRAGLARDGERPRGWWRTRSGGCAHLYVNLKGREPGGVVEPAEMAARSCGAAAAASPAPRSTASDVVEAMFRREDLARLGLDTPNAGDLVVFLRPGFNGDPRDRRPRSAVPRPGRDRTASTVSSTPTPRWPRSGWPAAPGVPARRVTEASLTEVAAFVSRLAGVQPPAQARR